MLSPSPTTHVVSASAGSTSAEINVDSPTSIVVREALSVAVFMGVFVGVGVAVGRGVFVGVGVAVFVGVGVAVGRSQD